jgi:amidase
MDELLDLDATAQGEHLRRGDISAVELIDAAIARVEKMNGRLNAVIAPAFERAREAAKNTTLPGPFGAVPFLMKDLGGQEANAPYCAGMRFLRDAGWVEKRDSFLTLRFRDAGLISLGRTNTPELGLMPTTEPASFGPTRNPWNLDHSAGGSSGGAAAAVAAGLVPLAHASDGGGSIRIPASSCGLIGLKPTRGRNSFGPGLGERWNGFSCEFVVSRSVRDSARLLDATAEPMPGDPYYAAPPQRPFANALDAAPPRLRIGVMSVAPRREAIHPECVAAVRHTAQLLAAAGHAVEDSHPPALDDAENPAAYVDVVAANVARALEVWGEAVGRPVADSDVEPLTWQMAQRGRALSAAALLARIEYTHGLGRRLAAWWEDGFDLLLTPTVGAPPPPIGYLEGTPEEPFRGIIRAAPLRDVHTALQHVRSAGDLRSPVPDARRSPRPADRLAARRRLRPRGPSLAGRRAARTDPALGRRAPVGRRGVKNLRPHSPILAPHSRSRSA